MKLLIRLFLAKHTQAAKVLGALRRSLAKRYTHVLDRAETLRGQDQTGFVRSLAAIERELFFVAQHSATAFFQWRMRESERLVGTFDFSCYHITEYSTILMVLLNDYYFVVLLIYRLFFHFFFTTPQHPK